MDDPRYPIYSVGVQWTQDGSDSNPRNWWPTNPGEGRIWNQCAMSKMLREPCDPSELQREFRENWWPVYIANDLRGQPPIATLRPRDVSIRVSDARFETWCLTWFEHFTFDIGQSDEEALASFERYVRRYDWMQDYPYDNRPKGYLCLMGAEDRWRWHGAGKNGERDARTDPPCRCKHCKEQGVIRIGH